MTDEDWCEVVQRQSGLTDTLLQQPEITDNIISFAPGRGNRPVSYSTVLVAKCELRCQDRRAAQLVPNLFYKLKKLRIKQIQDTASSSLRKCKTKDKKYTAGDFKTGDYVNELKHLDESLEY